MAHEMVHAYDHLRFKVDWTDNLRHAACTEVLLPTTNQGSIHRLTIPLARSEPARSAANADGHASSSAEANGNSHSSIKNVCDEEQFYPSGLGQPARMTPMPREWSMKSGIAASKTHGRLMKSSDDTSSLFL